jgi:hypothetical protein
MTGTSKNKPRSPGKPKSAVTPATAVDAVFKAYPRPAKAKLLALRRLIFDTAKATKGVAG